MADCENTIPIIVQSFDYAALEKYATLSDLPLVYLFNTSMSPDFAKLSATVHGVGPASAWLTPSMEIRRRELGLKADEPFCQQMHELDLAVHPYTL